MKKQEAKLRRFYFYAQEKMSTAIKILAISPGDVRSRLVKAYMELHTLEDNHLPPKLIGEWKRIKLQLTKYGPVFNHKGEVWFGSVQNTMNRIKNSSGARIAKKIFDLNLRLQQY